MPSPHNRPFVQEPESFVHALLGAQDISTLAFIADGHLRRMGLRDLRLIWNHAPGDPGDFHTSNDTPPTTRELELLDAARRQGGRVEVLDPATGSMQLLQRVKRPEPTFSVAVPLSRGPVRMLIKAWAKKG